MLKDVQRKTSRAALLPLPGDPFLFHFWYKMFKRHWGDEVDKLYVYLNSPVEEDVIDFIKDLVKDDPKVNLTYVDHQVEHGECINRMLDLVEEKYIVLMEDDCYIWGRGIIAQCFNLLECGSADIVGSKRGSCGTQILEGAKEKWGLVYEGVGDQGPNFWPNLFFSNKELLLKTDRNFVAKEYKAGELIKELDITPTETQFGDTFVSTSLQLRNMVPEDRIHYIPQYHGHPEDIEHYEKKKFLFDGHAQWCHIGSLSTGVGGLIKDDENRPLTKRLIDPPGGPTILSHAPTNEFQTKEYERRVQWWLTFYWEAPALGLAEFRRMYKEGIDRIVTQFKLNRKRIERRRQIYAALTNHDRRPLI